MPGVAAWKGPRVGISGAHLIDPQWAWYVPSEGKRWIGHWHLPQRSKFNVSFYVEDKSCASIEHLRFAVDDSVASARLNHYELTVRGHAGYDRLAELEHLDTFSPFVHGYNFLEIEVVNGGGVGGLYVEGSIIASCNPPPAPPPWAAEKVRAVPRAVAPGPTRCTSVRTVP